jgi:secreted PhoX family phosphatase
MRPLARSVIIASSFERGSSMATMSRREFVRRSVVLGGTLAAAGPLQAFYARTAAAGARQETVGYGPLVLKGDLFLPAQFNYQVISRQGQLMSDGQPTPGIFDGMAAYPGQAATAILIRNHENRERAGEQKVVTGAFEYDQTTLAGNTKLVVRRTKAGRDPLTGEDLYSYEVVRDFAILGGTSTNCAGGIRHPHAWLACEEVVKGPTGGSDGMTAPKRHGYVFEIDATADGPVPAIPAPQLGRFVHEAALQRAGVVYLTEDRSIEPDPRHGAIGSCFYRYEGTPHGGGVPLWQTSGVLQALKLRDVFHANMDEVHTVGVPFAVEWVTVDDPDHDDDTDNRKDRQPGFIPTRVQAQDKGAAFFHRQEGMWAGPGDAKIYFDCTQGGAIKKGQVWEYDPGRETITLVYESTDAARLDEPDNIVIVPQTQDMLLCEDSPGEQFIRGLTVDGQIYDFARTATNHTEFAGACFDPDGQTLYVNQQGERGSLPEGPPNQDAVTYAIYGPFEKRLGSNNKNFGNGPGA